MNFLLVTVGFIDENSEASVVNCTSYRVNEAGEFLEDLSFWHKDLENVIIIIRMTVSIKFPDIICASQNTQ